MVNTKEKDRTKRTIVKESKQMSPRRKKLYGLVGGLIALIMIGSGLIIGAFNTEDNEYIAEKFDYNGYSFIQHVDGHYILYYDSFGTVIPISFYIDPREAEDLKVTDNVRFLRDAQKLYLAFDPNEAGNFNYYKAAMTEFARVMPFVNTDLDSSRVVPAFTEDTDPISELVPVVTCDEATYLIPLVVFSIDEGITEPRVYNKENCIHVQASNYTDLMLASDRLAYGMLGVISFDDPFEEWEFNQDIPNNSTVV